MPARRTCAFTRRLNATVPCANDIAGRIKEAAAPGGVRRDLGQTGTLPQDQDVFASSPVARRTWTTGKP